MRSLTGVDWAILHFQDTTYIIAKIQKKGTFWKTGLIHLAYLLNKKSQQKGPLLCHVLDLSAPVAMTWDPLFIVFKLRAAILSALGAQDCSISLGCKWQVRGSPNLSGTEETSCIFPSDILVEPLSKQRHLDTVELESGSEVSRKHVHLRTLVSPSALLPCLSQTNSRTSKIFYFKMAWFIFILQRTTNCTFSSCHSLYLKRYMSVHKCLSSFQMAVKTVLSLWVDPRIFTGKKKFSNSSPKPAWRNK